MKNKSKTRLKIKQASNAQLIALSDEPNRNIKPPYFPWTTEGWFLPEKYKDENRKHGF